MCHAIIRNNTGRSCPADVYIITSIFMKKPADKKEREKADRRRRRAWDLAQKIVGPWARSKFGFSFEDFDPSETDGPLLVAINHACAYDPIFTGIAFRKKPLTFIASEHLLRTRPWGPVIDRYFSIIPHQKGARGSRTALVAMKRIKKGESIFLAVEGEQTWDGKPMPVMPYTGKLAKGSGATLITYRLEGAYLSAPRWASNTRKGKVYGQPVNIYSPEKLKGMSDEEVEAAIAEDLAFDIWEWQKAQPGGPVRYVCSSGGKAEGLERAVFTCPECGRMDALRSDGDHIGCSCGFKLRLEDTGFFAQPAPFETIADWTSFDKKTLGTVLSVNFSEDGERELFADDDITLVRIEDGHSDEEAATGKLTLSACKDGYMLRIGDFCFDMKKISNMTMVLAGRIVFSDESGYYEIRSGKKHMTNLIKYVIARDILKETTEESE